MTRLEIDRAETAHTTLEIETHAPGRRNMPIEQVLIGNDVPITAEFYDDAGNLVDPDDTDSDGNGNATIHIVGPDDTDEVASGTEMTRLEAGSFEYVWDTSTVTDGDGEYTVEVTADVDGETKLGRDTITLAA